MKPINVIGKTMAKSGSQKFLARNRAPRVQIEYDVELYGAQKKVSIPFVMGVMADLSGAAADGLPPVEERKALEIDADNFNDRLDSVRPAVSFSVANALTGEGDVSIALEFRHLDDFSPTSIARHVEPLARLLEARTQLANLGTYLDGKAGAEKLIGKAIQDPTLLAALAAARPGTVPVEN